MTNFSKDELTQSSEAKADSGSFYLTYPLRSNYLLGGIKTKTFLSQEAGRHITWHMRAIAGVASWCGITVGHRGAVPWCGIVVRYPGAVPSWSWCKNIRLLSTFANMVYQTHLPTEAEADTSSDWDHLHAGTGAGVSLDRS